jgi:hypothetical protein
MATSSAALIVHEDGTLEATPELKDTLHLVAGSRLEFVQQTGDEVRFRMPKWPDEIRSWRDLQGILAHSDADPNAELELERLRELESDSR